MGKKSTSRKTAAASILGVMGTGFGGVIYTFLFQTFPAVESRVTTLEQKITDEIASEKEHRAYIKEEIKAIKEGQRDIYKFLIEGRP